MDYNTVPYANIHRFAQYSCADYQTDITEEK